MFILTISNCFGQTQKLLCTLLTLCDTVFLFKTDISLNTIKLVKWC